MTTTTILTDRLTDEVEALALEIFCTTYMCDWQQSIDTALATITDLADYAEDWDASALAMRLSQHEDNISFLMRVTGCTLELAVAARCDCCGECV